MNIHDSLTREHILQSIEECDRMGRDAFLERYSFGHARSYFLVHNGNCYDSKAIVGVAHKYASGRALERTDKHGNKTFFGGKPIRRVLEKLGFEMEVIK